MYFFYTILLCLPNTIFKRKTLVFSKFLFMYNFLKKYMYIKIYIINCDVGMSKLPIFNIETIN